MNIEELARRRAVSNARVALFGDIIGRLEIDEPIVAAQVRLLLSEEAEKNSGVLAIKCAAGILVPSLTSDEATRLRILMALPALE